jgi:capsular exopolysaccharide synthesis family protein
MDQTMERADNFLPRVDESSITPNQVDRRVVSLTAPASTAAEQYRTLYYRLERLRELRPMKVVALTSAMQGEGKTVTSVNLALTSARANPDRRILLLDADLRRGQVGEVLGCGNKPGLADFLAGEAELNQIVRGFKATRLAVIPSGAVPEEPTQLLASARMKELLQAVRANFDEVYVDLPPTLPFADAPILACQADGVVMVIRANVTPSLRVDHALEQLAGAPVVGCVLNGAELSSTPYLKSYMK